MRDRLPTAFDLLAAGRIDRRRARVLTDGTSHLDPDDAARRYHHAVQDRRVVAEPTDDGTANLFGIDLPPHAVVAAMNRINAMARSLTRLPNRDYHWTSPHK